MPTYKLLSHCVILSLIYADRVHSTEKACDGAPVGAQDLLGRHCLFLLDNDLSISAQNRTGDETYVDRDVARNHCDTKYGAWLPVWHSIYVIEAIRKLAGEGYVPLGIKRMYQSANNDWYVKWDTGISMKLEPRRPYVVPWWLEYENGNPPFLWIENASFVSPAKPDTAPGPIHIVCHRILHLKPPGPPDTNETLTTSLSTDIPPSPPWPTTVKMATTTSGSTGLACGTITMTAAVVTSMVGCGQMQQGMT